MKPPRLPAIAPATPCLLLLVLLLMLGGCASNPRLDEAREFAAESAKLGGYADLTQRFRDTYIRQQPYLSPAAEQRERLADARRRAAYPDLMAIHEAVALYMQALGRLAGGDTFDLKQPLKAMGSSIKAWPETGLTDRHVNAYSGLAQLLARAASQPYQERAVQAMVRDGDQELQALLEAMQNLLRYYSKSSDNERDTVLGMLEVEIPFADTPRDRLLAALAKSHRQAKRNEYRLAGLRHTLAAKHVAAIAAAHLALAAHMARPDDPAARSTLAASRDALRASAAAVAGAAPVTE
ncbi:hypothetical protein [Massilia sp. Root351]|jgi:hypothetical protein|uniref:hypothetical protein n=1 Tax=Massilia sp. Root351 TaxID=1736522 RepID=UPI000B134831|nr:hypothetical protein [Massilia sp. Root351]